MKRFLIQLVLLFFSTSTIYADKVSINVQAGQLKDVIKSSKKYKIDYLEISGTLNGSDILFLREMMGSDRFGNETGKGRLGFLNLSKAQIVRGGSSYYRYKAEEKDFYTSNGVIGEAMFDECPQLQAIVLPNNTTEIKWGAFYGCKNLKRVLLPETIEKIGESAFWDCVRLNNVEIPNKSAIEIGNNAFRNTGLTKIVIPSSVRSIGESAFGACVALDSVIIDAGLSSLPRNFCYGDENLTYVKLPESIISIGEGAFQKCKSLSKINIPTSLRSIGKGVFYECSSLKAIVFFSDVTEFGEGMFYMATSLTNIVLPSKLKKIPASTFAGCSSLRLVNIPRDCIYIDEDAFLACKKLSRISVLSKTIPKMGPRAFSSSNINCEVVVPKGTLQSYKSVKNWSYFPNLVENPEIIVEGFVGDPLLENAKKGHKGSQYQLGMNFLKGENGYTQNEKEGLAWILKAAQQNHVKAQALAGYCYHRGKGTAVDYKKAVFWYTKAANAGDGQAQNNLGVLYFNGMGVPKNKEKGIYWKKKAAANGIVSAQQDLREMGIYNYK